MMTNNNLIDINTIEAALLEEHSVEECVVQMRHTDNTDQQLIAFVVSNGPFVAERLQTHLQAKLPAELLPSAYVPLSALPRTADGQLDQAVLARMPVIDTNLVQRWDKPVFASKKLSLSYGGQLQPEINAPTRLSDILERAALKSKKGIVYIQSDGREQFQSYQNLLEDAQRILAGLRKSGMKPQDKVIFQIEPGPDFIPAFWGCILGGFIPVPISIAPTYQQTNNVVNKLHNAWQMLEQPLVLTNSGLAQNVRSLSILLNIADFKVETVDNLRNNEPLHNIYNSQPNDLTLLLLTSGSTGMPKAVMLNHRNLLSMSAGTVQMNDFSNQDVTLNWMPLDHVGAIVFLGIMAVDLGCQQIHLPTDLILKNPLKWLELIERHRASISWAPNFAFSLLNERAQEINQRQWDLSSMRFLVNAGEQIVTKTARNFLKLLQTHGLPSHALRPAFGMSETCSGMTWSKGFSLDNSSDEMSFVELGGPIPGASLRIVDENNQIVAEGTIGRFQVKGPSVTEGYYQNPERNREVFSDDGWFNTGDIGYLQDGHLILTGRDKDDIIINGINYYSHEIESVVEEIENVDISYTAACAVQLASDNSDKLAIFFVSPITDQVLLTDLIKKIRGHVIKNVGINPNYLIPVNKETIPKTAIGKIQRSQLSKRFEAGEFEQIIQQWNNRPEKSDLLGTPKTEIEQQIANIWQEVLGLSEVGIHDNFFELGGHSLLLVQAQSQLQERFGTQVSIVDMFKYPSIEALAKYFSQSQAESSAAQQGYEHAKIRKTHSPTMGHSDIAIIGLSCRFPGADNIDEFWQNLRDGVESITFFTDEEITASGVDPALLNNPNYVKASPILSDVESFDAEFFGYGAREAEWLDPQQRLLLECAWESMEEAGYNSLTYEGVIGMYAGATMNTYLLNNIYPNRHQLDTNDDLAVTTVDSMGGFQVMVANDKDYLTTRVSYKLNLRGPSVNVQTACSTSLVAIHMAVQSLLTGECDMMLAGGVSVQVPQKVGHLYQEGMIVSPDGHCRAFDARAEGTIFGSGVGVVLLKRLDEALADGDHIYAVIKGSASHNDGGTKVGYMAPSGDGQAVVVSEAIAMADVKADTITYVETHGTGTVMGDPIEVNGLTQAFRVTTDKKGYCAIGSVKTNVGHLQITSGIVGFIKTVLALYHKQIPPSLHFEQPNPAIDFANSPFYVNTKLTDWQTNEIPRRAGVNSLGIGGANVHVILEEAPPAVLVNNESERSKHLLTLSARNEKALQDLLQRYETFLLSHPETSLADICFTANTGRVHFDHRLAIVADSTHQLRTHLIELKNERSKSNLQAPTSNIQNIAFLFTGQGAQYVGMGLQLYETQPTFRNTLDRCDDILRDYLDKPLLEVLYPRNAERQGRHTQPEVGNEKNGYLDETIYTQPALFALEYALAELWQSWGIKPAYVMGHSVGEYVAACVAGVFSLEAGLKLVTERARLMSALPQHGEMVTVFANQTRVATAIQPYLQHVSMAAINGPENIVISGQRETINTIMTALEAEGIKTKVLNVSHAFHSPQMESILPDFEKLAKEVSFSLPQINLISNLTGELATEEITTPAYWCRHLRQPVKFAASMETLSYQYSCDVFVEIGPKPALLGMGRECLPDEVGVWLPSLRQNEDDWQSLLQSMGELYVRGATIDWAGFDHDYQRKRVALPTYPFQRQRYWLEPPPVKKAAQKAAQIEPKLHPLLDKKIYSPLRQETLFETYFHPDVLPFLADHLIYDKVVASGACHIAMLLGATELTFGIQGSVLEEILFEHALVVPPEGCTVQLIITQEEKDKASFKLISFSADPTNWTVHVTGKILTEQKQLVMEVSPSESETFQTLWNHCPQTITAAEFYQIQHERYIHLGPSYQWMGNLCRGNFEAVCQINRPPSVIDAENYQLHPGLIDAGFGLLASAVDMEIEESFVPFSIEKISFYQRPHHFPLSGHLKLRSESGPDRLIGDIRLFDPSGQMIVEFIGFEGRKAARKTLLGEFKTDFSDWFYDIVWQPKAIPQGEIQPEKSGLWLIFADQNGKGFALAERLQKQGGLCTLVQVGQTYEKRANGHYQINPVEPQDFQRLLADLNHLQLRGIVHLWSLDGTLADLRDAQHLACASILHLVQSLVKHSWAQYPHLWLVTQGGQAVNMTTPIQVSQTPAWGLGRVIALEHPELHCVCIDLDPSDQDETQTLLNELLFSEQEEQVAWRQNVRQVARWERRILPSPENPLSIDENNSYLISGGTGALGLPIAQWLVEQGARHILLLSRSGVSSTNTQKITQMEQAGANVQIIRADVTEAEALNQILDKTLATMPPLRGIVHAAGVLDDGMLIGQNWHRFEKVIAAKVYGAWNLHQYTANMKLDFFVMFSSAASILGNQGQSNYAPANAFLDGLAHYRKHHGLAATSINWGPFAGAGMAASTRSDQLSKQGFKPISSADGLIIMETILSTNVTQVGAMQCDWHDYIAQFSAEKTLFTNWNQPKVPNPVQETKIDWWQKIDQAPSAEEKKTILLDFVSNIAGNVIGINAKEGLDTQKPLMEQGIDSLQAVEIRNRLGKGLEHALPVSLIFEYPTVNELVDYLAKQILELETDLQQTQSATQATKDNFDYIDDLSDEELEDLINREII